MAMRMRKPTEANDGSYAGTVLDAFDRMEAGLPPTSNAAVVAAQAMPAGVGVADVSVTADGGDVRRRVWVAPVVMGRTDAATVLRAIPEIAALAERGRSDQQTQHNDGAHESASSLSQARKRRLDWIDPRKQAQVEELKQLMEGQQ